MKLIHTVELRYQVGFYGPNSKKKTVRRIGLESDSECELCGRLEES
jgi:hypothetical protein